MKTNSVATVTNAIANKAISTGQFKVVHLAKGQAVPHRYRVNTSTVFITHDGDKYVHWVGKPITGRMGQLVNALIIVAGVALTVLNIVYF